MSLTHAELQDRISRLSNVTKTDLWTKVMGKERLYISTKKFNGGKSWNSGVGYTTLFVDLKTMTLKKDGCAGAATRDALANTLARIEALLTK